MFMYVFMSGRMGADMNGRGGFEASNKVARFMSSCTTIGLGTWLYGWFLGKRELEGDRDWREVMGGIGVTNRIMITIFKNLIVLICWTTM